MRTESTKLNLYIVVAEGPTTYLVIAESADAAQDVTFERGWKKIENVGRLGAYEPGIEGHSLVMQLTSRHQNGSIVLVEKETK
jgi:hypothetical protein